MGSQERRSRAALIVVYLPTGADLRLMKAGEFRRTVLFRNGDELNRRQEEWKAALLERGCSPRITSCRQPDRPVATLKPRYNPPTPREPCCRIPAWAV